VESIRLSPSRPIRHQTSVPDTLSEPVRKELWPDLDVVGTCATSSRNQSG
jgi:hypothetical protein